MTVTPPPEDARVVRPFADWLIEHNHGETAVEAAAELHDLIEQCEALNKAGTLTLTIKLVPAGKKVGVFATTVEIASRPPKPEPEPSMFYVDADGNLTRTDPRQQALGFPRGIGSTAQPETGPAMNAGGEA